MKNTIICALFVVCLTKLVNCVLIFDSIHVEYGSNLGEHVISQLRGHLGRTSDSVVLNFHPDILTEEGIGNRLILSLGNAGVSSSLIDAGDLNSLPPESFLVRSLYNTTVSNSGSSSSTVVLAANGLPLSDSLGRNSSLDRTNIHYGAILGSYHILELLGFAWMHPLSPMAPARVQLQNDVADQVTCRSAQGGPSTTSSVDRTFSCIAGLDITESPRWPHRAFHLHTQHPIELTEVLQGFDIPQQGTHGPRCSHFSKHAAGVVGRLGSVAGSGQLQYVQLLQRTLGATSQTTLGSAVGLEDPVADKLWRELWNSSVGLDRGAASGVDLDAHGPDGRRVVGHRQRSQSGWAGWWSRMAAIATSGAEADRGSAAGTRGYTSGEEDDDDEAGYCERWEDMVSEVNLFFEWCVVNRLNKVEWLLLGNYKWDNHIHTRQHRLAVLVSLGHQYSIVVGGNSPLGNIQQHGWFMTDTSLSYAQQVQQIKSRVDWVFEAGFDFLTTESGSSEFTHPECGLMLDLMNVYADYVATVWGREAGIKVHCSTGQICEEFPDPRSGEPINFNFLPTYATPALGVYPHTIQVYAMNDPTNGVYGNDNFSHMEEYLVYEAKKKPETGRIVLYYGETSYWVNADIDVPLFLPLFAQRRQADLQRLGRREEAEHFRMDGQMNFDSGWEWAYWLNDVVTARASWDPMLAIEDPWVAFEASLQPFLRLYPSSIGVPLGELLVELTQVQEKLFVYGDVSNAGGAGSEHCSAGEENSCAPPAAAGAKKYHGAKHAPNTNKLSGLAYLQGDDTWIDLPRMMGLHLLQPDKVHLQESNDALWPQVLQLLGAMEDAVLPLHLRMRRLLLEALKLLEGDSDYDISRTVSPASLELLLELHDSLSVLLLRIQQVHKLYRSRGAAETSETTAVLQGQSRELIQHATTLVLEREKRYRVHVHRIGAWRDNPTVYRYGYLWSVHSLYYWWRDQGIAEAGTVQAASSPCYLNRMDTTEIAMGFGKSVLEMLRAFVNKYSPFVLGFPLELVNCAAPAPREYKFPRDLYHYD